MSYTPTTWTTGDTITASALNKIENGIADAGGGGSSWDAIIRLTHSNDDTEDIPSTITPSIVEGTYAGLYAKHSNGEYPTILVEYTHPLGTRFAVPMAYILGFNNNTLYLIVAGFSPMQQEFAVYGTLLWGTSDVIEWQIT